MKSSEIEICCPNTYLWDFLFVYVLVFFGARWGQNPDVKQYFLYTNSSTFGLSWLFTF